MISVIIPAYNAEKYIKRSVESVCNQTYAGEVEIIIVDDGSTDNTYKLSELLKEKDNRIILLQKENGGLSDARNYGIKAARGDYIAFLDADDAFDIHFLQYMYDAIIESKSDMAVCGYWTVYANGNKVPSCTFDHIIVCSRQATIRELIIGKKMTSHSWNKLYKKHIFDTIRYPKGKNYEDMYVAPQIVSMCNSVVFLPYNLVDYYQIETSITHVISVKNECFAFDAAYQRFNLYKNEYDDLYSYLVSEPLRIGLKLWACKKSNDDNKYFQSIEAKLMAFLRKAKFNRNAYKELNFKYKILLLFYPILKGVINC